MGEANTVSIPCNQHDYQRFLKLAELLRNQTPPVEMHIYASANQEGTSYVSLQINGNIKTTDVLEAFGAAEPQTLTADEVFADQN